MLLLQDAVGFTLDMDSNELVDFVKERLTCDKQAKKTILGALEDGDVAAATTAMGEKYVLSL
jgi:acetoacetate decarboxylase